LISQNEKIATKPSDQVHLAMTIDMVARLTFPSAFVMFLAFFFFYYSVNANNRAISVGTDWTNCQRSQWSRSYHKRQSGHLHPYPHHNPLGWPDKNTTQNEGSTVMAHQSPCITYINKIYRVSHCIVYLRIILFKFKLIFLKWDLGKPLPSLRVTIILIFFMSGFPKFEILIKSLAYAFSRW